MMAVPELEVLMLLDRPWARVREPTPLPRPLTVEQLRSLTEVDLARLLRDHLVPRAEDPDGRGGWERLWALLRAEDDLAERAFDVLEDLLEVTETALAGGGLREAEVRRARKTQRLCQEAWRRLEVDDDGPLAWAGRAARGFNPPARRVLAQLVDAVDAHRREVRATGPPGEVDERLWRVLGRVGLDPETAGPVR